MSALPGVTLPPEVGTKDGPPPETRILNLSHAIAQPKTPEAEEVVNQLGAKVQEHSSAIRRFHGKEDIPFSRTITKENLAQLVDPNSPGAENLVNFLGKLMEVSGDLTLEIHSPSSALNSSLLKKLGRLRKKAFVDGKKWDIPLIGDDLDISVQDLHSYHFVVKDSDGNILGSMRLAMSNIPPKDMNIPDNIQYLDRIYYLRKMGFLASEDLDRSNEDLDAEVLGRSKEMELFMQTPEFAALPQFMKDSLMGTFQTLAKLQGKNINQLSENVSAMRELARSDQDSNITKSALKGSITSVERFFITPSRELGDKYKPINRLLKPTVGLLLQTMLAGFSIATNMPRTIIQSDQEFTQTLLQSFGVSTTEGNDPMARELNSFGNVSNGGAVRLISKATQMNNVPIPTDMRSSVKDPAVETTNVPRPDDCYTLELNFCHALEYTQQQGSVMADLTQTLIQDINSRNANVINYKEIEN